MSYYPDDISEKERYDLFMTRIEDWIRTAMTRYRGMWQLCDRNGGFIGFFLK
jgi:hypothetical protein